MTQRLVAQVELGADVAEPAVAALVTRLASCADAVDGLERSHAGLHGPGSQGGGDLTWDLLFRDEAACRAFCARASAAPGVGLLAALGDGFADLAPAVASADAVVLDRIAAHVGRPGLVGVKRTLLLRVRPEAPADRLDRFERDTLGLPRAVPAIRNWCLSRVHREPSPTGSRWTHVWEQEFDGEEALQVDYMASPYHWGHVDAWFDPEHPTCIVDPWLAHTWCRASESVLSWPGVAG